MTNALIQQMKLTKRLKLSFWETVTHFSIVPFLLLIFSFNLPGIYRFYFTDNYTGFRNGGELIQISILWLILAIVFYFIQRRQLRFHEFVVNQNADEFKEAVKRTQIEQEWLVENCNSVSARAFRPWNWTGSWGEMITIIRDDNKILINSICDPHKFASVTAAGWNKRNVKAFINNLKEVKQGLEQVMIDSDSTVINEWTLKKILIRILFYPFSIFLISVAIIKCIPDGKIGLAIGALFIGGAYLYWDIQALMLNRRLKKREEGK
jgi:hypothetical protein